MSEVGDEKSYLAIVPSHLTPMRYGAHPWKSSNGEHERGGDGNV